VKVSHYETRPFYISVALLSVTCLTPQRSNLGPTGIVPLKIHPRGARREMIATMFEDLLAQSVSSGYSAIRPGAVAWEQSREH